MAVTVVKTPQGHKIIDQAIAADISEDYSGDALVTFPYHGLVDGDYVYITSNIDEYNGFFYVTTATSNTFKISEHSAADFVEYYQDAEIDYYQTQTHEWSSIFLPIVYKCSNDHWPINSVDVIRTISSSADDNGYSDLTLSGDIKSSGGGINALEFVKISGASDEELNNVWQIVEVISNSNIVINLPYDSTNSFTGATIQFYYNNYQVKVKIFAGLPPLHPWYAKKPYEEVAELSLTPDENNEVMFSISDYIQGKVNIKNNPTLYTMPLNLDAFTGFYISTAESYDNSDNYTLTTQETDFAVDTFQGYAIAGKLPFKNVYSGDYADYVMTSGSPALWLTNHDRLLAVEGYYFDVSFIKNIRGDFQIIIDKYVADYAITETQTITDQGIGVYRIQITPDVNYDSFCIRAYTPGVAPTGGVPSTTLAALADWTNVTFGWTLGANPTVSVNGNGGVSNYIEGAIITTAGYDYEFTTAVDIGVTGVSSPISELVWVLLDSSNNVVDSVTYNYITAGVKTETFTLSSVIAAASLALHITNNTPFDTKNYTINSAVYNAPAAPDDSIAAQNLTEEICIDILETCDAAAGFTSDAARRLTEDGGYRLLE